MVTLKYFFDVQKALDFNKGVRHTLGEVSVKKGKGVFFFLLLVLLTILFSVAVYAVQCWEYDNDETTCKANADCQWHEDPWGSWCEEKGCWNFFNQTDCSNSATLINQSCQWDSSSSGWCAEAGCWNFDGTNQTACESNSAGLTCNWESECEGPSHLGCWDQGSESSCLNITGCVWGFCDSQGCWDYESESTCEANVGENGNACQWDNQYSNCYESSCWDNTNKTACESASCSWDNGYCSSFYCGDFSYSNVTACVNNTAGLDCSWDGTYCSEVGCWQNSDAATCGTAGNSSCFWETTDSGWCEELNCWNYENTSWGLGVGLANETACVNNSAGIECIWDGNGGWCYENITSQGCADFTNLKDCADSFYCLWNSTGSTCSAPSGGIATDFSAWNPGCYIFDEDQTSCESTSGCYWDGACQSNSSVMLTNELNCTVISDSGLCNSIPVLDTCCIWQGSSCTADTFSNTCRDQVQEPPAGAFYCEDYNAYTDSTLCKQIAGSPWFMPCDWNNASERCEVKHDDIFTEGKENIMYLDNEKSCEYAGGNWVTESYCVGDVSVPTGHCEFKFDDEKNCDRACYACEYKSDGTNWSTSAESQSACIGSALGVCEYDEDTTAENGFGFCDVKDEFINGIATGTCDSDCGTCTYMGDANSDTPENRPSYFCSNSEANCKWIPDLVDSTDESKGRCASNAEKTCDDKCDKCYEEFLCTSYGAKKGDSSLATQCTWDDTTDVCLPNTGSGQLEICWDGIDNNNDNKIDCADSQCFSDSFCGGEFIGGTLDCWGYNDQSSCSTAGCDWVDNTWGSWCDMPGANCWVNDGTNQTYCEAQGCEWHGGSGGFCEDDWSVGDSCFSLNMTTCQGATGQASNCTWAQDDWCTDVGGWCENDNSGSGSNFVDCYGLYNQWGSEDKAGCLADSACKWENDTWCETQGADAGWCDHSQYSCWQYDNNQTGCEVDNADWCVWKTDQWGSYCDSKNSDFGDANSCWSQSNESVCGSATGCNWISGLCDPPGFGSDSGTSNGTSVTGSGMACYVHDGNQTGCEGTTGCGWFDEPNPFCDVDFGSECPQHSYNQTICASYDQCYWEANGGYCNEKAFNCFSNSSLTSEAACDAHPQCAWNSNYGGCESACFAKTTSNTCGAVNVTNPDGTDSGTNLCNWASGWCGSAMSAEFFKDMEGGVPIPVDTDTSGDATPVGVDILGHGMKDLGDAFGFGIEVNDLSGSAMCNGIKLDAGGSGTGTNKTRAYWYLDTDGNTSNNCKVIYDSSDTGYEFYFSYTATYNNDTSTVNEQYSAYRCSNGNFITADIKLTGFRQKMCTEIGGPMVAVDKVDLEKFPTLYTPGSDLRVRASMANSTGNSSVVSDDTSSGYASPGAVDFSLDDLDIYVYQSNGTGHYGQDTASKGYVEYTADCWTASGCADYSCLNHPYCTANSLGVHASGFTDTRTPKVVAIAKETYPDSALISYFTDKPANGTLLYYGTDSTCTTLSATINDTGLNNPDVRTHKLWHEAEIYDDNGTYSLNTALSQNVKYYYKVKVCDSEGKCGISKCSSFTTDSTTDCAMCEFVTKLDVPTGWNVKYDLNIDGTYEHVQGQVCGTNAGMQTNYTTGRNANIRLYKTDNSTWIDFINASLTKTGLSSKVSDIDSVSDFAAGTTTDSAGDSVGYVGLISSTRDKIINNLHPEVCKIKVPSDGTCDALWHCDDDLDTCVNRTSEATLLTTNSDSCEWQLPYCEFSAWASGQPGSVSSSSGGSGGGGGGGGASAGGGGGGGFSLTSDEEVVEEVVEAVAQEPVPQVAAPTAPEPVAPTQPEKTGLAGLAGMFVLGLETLGSSSTFWVIFMSTVITGLMIALGIKLSKQ